MKICVYVKQMKNFILDILFPVHCLGCNTNNEILCDNCVIKIRTTERETSDNIIAAYDYRDPLIKNAIWELKYHKKRYMGERLGQILYESLIEEISEIKEMSGQAIYVIPTPISNKKTKIRGYNQAIAIAKGFCNQAPQGTLELNEKVIIKKVETLPQARITNRKRRLENVQGVFGIKNEEIIKGRTIIIIDDVTTTGGTINEIMKILKKAGAKKVVGFAVAH